MDYMDGLGRYENGHLPSVVVLGGVLTCDFWVSGLLALLLLNFVYLIIFKFNVKKDVF